MSEVKVYVDKNIPKEGKFSLDDNNFIEHYLITVRRLNTGNILSISGKNRVVEARLTSQSPLTVKIKSIRPVKELGHVLTLYQALTRKKKFEETVKRGTELGVTKFVPLITERTVRVPNNPGKQKRRWKRIAMDSARISQRDNLPDITVPMEFDELEEAPDRSGYLADINGREAKEVFESGGNKVRLFIGPEGGFTEIEKRLLHEITDVSVRVGSRNLRAETASMALISLWLNATGNL